MLSDKSYALSGGNLKNVIYSTHHEEAVRNVLYIHGDATNVDFTMKKRDNTTTMVLTADGKRFEYKILVGRGAAVGDTRGTTIGNRPATSYSKMKQSRGESK